MVFDFSRGEEVRAVKKRSYCLIKGESIFKGMCIDLRLEENFEHLYVLK